MSGVTPIGLGDLHRFPLPDLSQADDKADRGQVLVVAGGRGVPGAALLTGLAALRAGAGKLQIAATGELAITLGVAAPEAAILQVPADDNGEIAGSAAASLQERARRAQAIVVGPGMANEESATAVACGLMRQGGEARFVVDAGALSGLAGHAELTRRLDGRLVITPHAGEMAGLCGCEKEAVLADPAGIAGRVARELGAVVALKGADTFVATPDGATYLHTGGAVGLATSGSGDVLAGVIGGLLARGGEPLAATLWGVCIHAAAGARLTQTVAPVGFLARELLDVIPAELARVPAGQSKAVA